MHSRVGSRLAVALVAAAVGLGVAASGCRKSESEAVEAPTPPAPAAAAADEGAEPAPTEAETVAAARRERAAQLEAERRAQPEQPPGVAPAKADAGAKEPEQGTTDCEGGRQFDELSIARQKMALARLARDKAQVAYTESVATVDGLLVEALRRQTEDCASKVLDAACVGAASGDPRRCTAPGLTGDLQVCRMLATFRQAAAARDVAGCDALDGVLRALCRGFAGGTFECPDGDGNEARVCRFNRDGAEPDCAGADKGEVCSTYWMTKVLAGAGAESCARLDNPATRSQCEAIASRDPQRCADKGGVPPWCREVVVETDVLTKEGPDGDTYEALARVTNIHGRPARCKALVTLRYGERVETSERDLGELQIGPEIRDVRWDLGPQAVKPALVVTTRCDWRETD